MLAIRDWNQLIERAYEHLRPGGWFEVGGTYSTPRSDDGTLGDDFFLKEVERLFFEMGEAMGTSLHAPPLWKEQLQRAGFIDIRESVFKLPQGVWPRDRQLKEIGAFENYSLTNGLDAYLLRGYTAILGGDPGELRRIINGTKRELRSSKMHSYVY
jgi:hypothetical protein